MTPSEGRIVHFYLNGDMFVSPAVIIGTARTFETVDYDVEDPELYLPINGDQVKPGGKSGADVSYDPIPLLYDDMHVHLLVFGLKNTYRVYNVPFAGEGTSRPGHWNWPPRV
jgi:hypothetical protein